MAKTFYIVYDMDKSNGEWIKVFKAGSYNSALSVAKKIENGPSYSECLPAELRKYTMIEKYEKHPCQDR
jgi:hypothetical protein